MVNSAPILTADWTAESGDQWIVPVGAGGGKVILLGRENYLLMYKPDYTIM